MPESRPDSAFVAVGAESKAFLRRGAVVPRRRRRGRAIRLALAAIVLAAAAVGLSRFFGGSLFALRRMEVSGNRRARTEEILRAVEPWRLANVVALDLAPIARAVRVHPWVERVTLSKRLPDGLAIRITERKAVALFREGPKLFAVAKEIGLRDRQVLRQRSGLTGERFVLQMGEIWRQSLPNGVEPAAQHVCKEPQLGVFEVESEATGDGAPKPFDVSRAA